MADSIKKPKQQYKIRYLFPTLVTLTGLSFGLLAIRFASIAAFEKAIACIFIAALLDVLDGGVARLLRSSSAFGVQVDSLSDAICFGVAPTFLAYYWSLHTMNALGWLLSVAITLSTVLRLARFNINKDAKYQYKKHFQGVPAPAGAILIMAPLAMELAYNYVLPPVAYGIYCLLVAVLMVSYLPTFALKHLNVKRQYRPILLFIAGLFITYCVQDYWAGLTLGAGLYWLTIPLISIPKYIKRHHTSL